MPYPHAMRLHGPWDYQPLTRWVSPSDGEWTETTADLPPPGRLRVPGDWGAALGTDYRGRVRFTRRFGLPTGLEARERVWLVIEGVDARGAVALNGQPLGEVLGYALPASFDVTERLLPRNELEIVAEAPPLVGTRDFSFSPPVVVGAGLRPGREEQPGGLIREVRLEVRHQSYIDQLAVHTTWHNEPLLHIKAVVAGPDVALNLHVIGQQRELAFVPVRPGQPLALTLPASDLPRWVPHQVNELEPIELRLLRGGEAVWEGTRAVAIRSSIEMATLSATTAQPLADAVYGAVPTEEELHQFDTEGTSIFPMVPAPWVKEVCGRLAHHPAIAAWAVPPAQTLVADGSPELYGRPWISSLPHGAR